MTIIATSRQPLFLVLHPLLFLAVPFTLHLYTMIILLIDSNINQMKHEIIISRCVRVSLLLVHARRHEAANICFDLRTG